MTRPLTVLWRGPLSSCNYDCSYCPFGKNPPDRSELERDERDLSRFLQWLTHRSGRTSVLFTPWGEGLIHGHYRRAIARASQLPQVERVAIQTNLTAPLAFLEDAQPEKVGLWSTYHPTEVSLERFVGRILEARRRGARVSAGTVATRENLDAIQALREALPREVYVWVNAVSGERYAPSEVELLTEVDPHFGVNLARPHPSASRACHTGETVISVDGDGEVKRCHFVPAPLGNLYDPDFEKALRPRPCPNAECRCHIGYVHMPHLELYDVFEGGVLERIPSAWGSSSKVSTT